MHQPHYNGLAENVNGFLKPLQLGECRIGALRVLPKTNEHGEAIVRLFVTNEVDMFVARNQLAKIKAWMWVGITALYLATFSGLVTFLYLR